MKKKKQKLYVYSSEGRTNTKLRTNDRNGIILLYLPAELVLSFNTVDQLD